MVKKEEEQKQIEYSHILNKAVLELNDGQLEGLPKNPRYVKDDKFAKLKLSLEQSPEFLKARPLLVYPLNNEHYIIVGGNMRFLAGNEVGIKDFPCYIFPKETTVDKLKEYVIKDNLAYGSTDWELIADEWNEDQLQDWGMDIPDFTNDIDVDEDTTSERKEISEDDYDPDNDDDVEIFVNDGEIWQCGDHRLLCGDSTKVGNVKLLMGEESAQMWLTYPPYNVGYGIDSHQRANGDAVLNDKQDEENFRAFLRDAFHAVKEVLVKGASYYIFHSEIHSASFLIALEQVGDMTLRQKLVWNKNRIVMGRQDYQWKHEPILYGWKDGAGHNWYSDRKQPTVIDWDRPTTSEMHPTMKPVGLFGYLMQNSSKEGDIVIDTFGGSGTTMIASEQLGRKARLIELSPKYCSVIIKRWEEMTGKKAERVES